MAQELLQYLTYYRKKLERGVEEEKVLEILKKLHRVSVTPQSLQESGIVKVIKQLRKTHGKIGEDATNVMKKWRSNCFPSQVNTIKVKVERVSSPHQKTPHVSNRHKMSPSNNHELPHKKMKYSNGIDDSQTLYKDCKKEVQDSLKVAGLYDPEQPAMFDLQHSNIEVKYTPTPILQIKSEKHSSHEAVKGSIKHSSNRKSPSQLQENGKKHSLTNGHSSSIKHSKEKDSNGVCVKPSAKKSHSSSSKTSSDKKTNLIKLINFENDIKPVTKESKDVKKRKMPSAEAFTASEASFEDCLGFNDIVAPAKKKKKMVPQLQIKKESSPHPSTSQVVHKSSKKSSHSKPKEKSKSSYKEKSSKSSKRHSVSKIPKDLLMLPKTLDLGPVDISSTLPEIQPNYKPLPRLDYESSFHKKKTLSNEEAILFTSSKKDRTAVYSGRKSFLTYVPSLYEICIRVLNDHIDNIEVLGGIPYYLIKPVLERCTAHQLYRVEDYNPYLLEETNELWERHCRRDFKMSPLEEGETWRELYLREFDEKERKLKALTANISKSLSNSNPVRQVKLAYVDSFVKPPRDVARRQAKHGTGLPVNHTVKAGPPSKATARPNSPAVNAALAVKPPTYSAPPKKPKVAPLMAKTLRALKNVYRR